MKVGLLPDDELQALGAEDQSLDLMDMIRRHGLVLQSQQMQDRR